MGRGMALVATVSLLALWPIAAHPEVAVRDAIAGVVFVVLIGYGAWIRISQRLHGHAPGGGPRAGVGSGEGDRPGRGDVGLLVTGWVPVVLLVGLGVLPWPHLTDANPALAAA